MEDITTPPVNELTKKAKAKKKAATPAKKKSVAAAKKTSAAAAPKKKVAAAATGKRGRVSAYVGKKIYKLVKTEESGLRDTGKVRDCWDLITNGITFETYREKAADGGLARKALADFIVKGMAEVK